MSCTNSSTHEKKGYVSRFALPSKLRPSFKMQVLVADAVDRRFVSDGGEQTRRVNEAHYLIAHERLSDSIVN